MGILINEIKPFKGRLVDYNRPVEVYRNLNRKGVVWSIKQGSLVVGHAQVVSLKDVEFKVNKSGQQRARRQQVRNVHARIFGFIKNYYLHENSDKQIYYNPYKTDYFTIKTTKDSILKAKEVCLSQTGVVAKF